MVLSRDEPLDLRQLVADRRVAVKNNRAISVLDGDIHFSRHFTVITVYLGYFTGYNQAITRSNSVHETSTESRHCPYWHPLRERR
ncbi:hypothetical protein SAMN04488556_3979 [Halostagnicola kamekurae]|uniref:Uncharacterized protein n=1 Tax=Halostagnicola kamekurae TaxID=619731 RepID=A0A1I6UPC9_9EURY|nr:hypothetical protein SAMN04488556_3979 [Halostagnicola kamekurae]